jgi:ribonuclease J
LTEKLKIIPLGGTGEVGKNMTLLEYGQDAIMIDCGLMFPESDMLGIDIVIPEIEYLLERPELLKAIFLTHGHEDHIGALPHVLNRIQAPLYSRKLTNGLIEVRLKEHKQLEAATINTVAPGDIIKVGPFRVQPFHVCHSIPDAMGLAVETPLGMVIHTGEYKFDPTPADGRLTDVGRLSAWGDQGVLALLSDSTNAERPGHTPSEKSVLENLDRIFNRARGRIIVSTFASNISRVQQIIDISLKHKRSVGVVGRSMEENVRMARNLGYLSIPDDRLLRIEDLDGLPPKRTTIVCTGTQGEPTSALVRMANKNHRTVQIRKGDTIILSATPIPGNEELVHRTLNKLFRLGADVIYHQITPVHVSGHGSQEEEKMMLNLTRPKYFIPIQGEYRMLVLHARLAREVGIPQENIFVVENGQVIEFDKSRARLANRVPAGHVFVDGLGVGDIGDVVLRDRHLLSRDGFVVCVVALDEEGEIADGPDLVSRGFVYVRNSEALLDEAADIVVEALTASGTDVAHRDTATKIIQNTLAEFFYQRTRRRPMIFPVVLEV